MIDARRTVMFLARGTSRNAAVYGRYLMETVCAKRSAIGSPSMATLYDAALDLTDTVAIVISQSGQTTELIEAAGWARRCGAITVAVTNTAGSPLVGACDHTLATQAGAELAVPATKSFTAALLTLAMVAGPQWGDELSSIGDHVDRLLRRLDGSAELDEAVELLARARAVVCTGRGFTLAAALEAALKLTETTGTPCVALSSADLQHGPLAMLGPEVPLVAFAASSGPTLAGVAAVAEEAERRRSPVVRVGGPTTPHLPSTDLRKELSPIGLAVVAQVLAEATGRARGADPDSPGGLTKVTQTAP